MANIEIDVAMEEDETLDTVMAEVFQNAGLSDKLSYELVTEHGPGGGNPVVRVTGDDEHVKLFEQKWDELLYV